MGGGLRMQYLPLNPYSARHVALGRILLSGYLLFYFLSLLPFSGVLYSDEGLFKKLNLSPFPNILYFYSSDTSVKISFYIAIALSILFGVGFLRRWVALLLWYFWACLCNHMPYIFAPQEGFIGWLLLLFVVLPKGEGLCLHSKHDPEWKIPMTLYIGAWLVLALGYSASGWNKWSSPSWQDGLALQFALEVPIAFKTNLNAYLQQLPHAVSKLLTYIVFYGEILFLPLIIHPYTRKWIWILFVFFHVSLLFLIDIHCVSWALLLFHYFTFDKAFLNKS